jgi:hypothetical protein
MSEESSVPDQSQSSADVQSVRDEFLRALEFGSLQGGGCSTFNFDEWLNRVDPKYRSELAHHFNRLQGIHSAATTETSDLVSTNLELAIENRRHESPVIKVPSISLSPREAAHESVFNCETFSRLPEDAKTALA